MAAHGIVCSGVRSRIGNGRTTLIWGHPWLPDNPSPLVKTIMPEELGSAWDPHILTDLFDDPEDVARISMISVSPDYEDTWFWLKEPTGIYTVKNVYRQIVGDYEHNPGTFDKWVKLWKMKVPPKWKTFLWRTLCDILPTTNNLIMKRVELEPVCPMCGLFDENVMHALITCDYSKMVWGMSGLPVINIVTDSLVAWLMRIFYALTEDQCGLAVSILYNIWNARNTAVWEQSLPRPAQVTRCAAAAVRLYRQVHQRVREPELAATSTTIGDSRPKCYINAGYRHNTGEVTYGAVLLSHHDMFMAATSGKLSGAFSAVMAEALACKEALSWLKERDIQKVDLLTDCSELWSALYLGSTPMLSYVGIIVDQCRTTMFLFIHCSLSYVSRTLNLHAHTLASLAFDQEQPIYWDFVPPDTIIQFI
ncbi:PREDICTED: uncharacterized protein LOC109156595 [Ipomoea nil]|uniref:uncharacterized protein LOC109156595 n=1 Tax=Ipomoea nil TaxID=35883 RepID=UPI0009015B0E|nr:PREDICTED: uncharacterized protein LOC109156595 [Ipomoea nil]